MNLLVFQFIGLKSMSLNVTFDGNLRNGIVFGLAQLMTEKSSIKVLQALQMLGE